MKPILTTTACIFAATVLCAHISTDDLGLTNSDDKNVAQASEFEASINSVSEFSPSMYGIIGAATMGLVIASRRQRA
ncbi:hypothetical protein [Pelagicoccus sp. SDUM812002]|uniref:hypothetical protein n=1 Tax=Pelagicoccus sp. SDUM812002 TaxID=3041266 RepID=UPI00280FDC94|nr:hypothetical protein [Pelagicoccus sp. SDUM812002]MDQ8186905.1 hypothetical protein [Pelagicoccus sp. SDUM812002]